MSVTFASANPNKFREVHSILSSFGISIELAQLSLVEIQSDSIEEIIKEKARNAYTQLRRPVLVEDDGLFIDSLNGFPGQYSSFAFKTIGNSGILKLLAGSTNRSAHFRSLIAHSDGENTSVFEGDVQGKISETITDGGWGYDPIFIPNGSDQTFGELGDRKNEYSHRRMSLEKFARNTKGSGYA